MNIAAILQSQSKAISAGAIAALVAEAARFGWHPQGSTVTAAGVIVTAVVSYIIGHLAVYFAPKNKPTASK